MTIEHDIRTSNIINAFALSGCTTWGLRRAFAAEEIIHIAWMLKVRLQCYCSMIFNDSIWRLDSEGNFGIWGFALSISQTLLLAALRMPRVWIIWETGWTLYVGVFLWGALFLERGSKPWKAIWWTTKSDTLQYLEIQLVSSLMFACKACSFLFHILAGPKAIPEAIPKRYPSGT